MKKSRGIQVCRMDTSQEEGKVVFRRLRQHDLDIKTDHWLLEDHDQEHMYSVFTWLSDSVLVYTNFMPDLCLIFMYEILSLLSLLSSH